MRQRGVRRVTGLIVLLGLAVVAWVMLSPERRRARLVAEMDLGDDEARVQALLGPPGATCPAGTLEHLANRFPTGTPPATVEQAITRLQEQTAARWVYPLRRGGRVGCVPGAGTTEVGFDRQRRVFWYVPVAGRVAIVAPAEILPAAAEN